jgi:hypothetical protein
MNISVVAWILHTGHIDLQNIATDLHVSDLLTYLLTYLRSWAVLEKLPIVQLIKNFPAF